MYIYIYIYKYVYKCVHNFVPPHTAVCICSQTAMGICILIIYQTLTQPSKPETHRIPPNPEAPHPQLSGESHSWNPGGSHALGLRGLGFRVVEVCGLGSWVLLFTISVATG